MMQLPAEHVQYFIVVNVKWEMKCTKKGRFENRTLRIKKEKNVV